MRSAVEQAVNGGEKNERVSVKLAQDQSPVVPPSAAQPTNGAHASLGDLIKALADKSKPMSERKRMDNLGLKTLSWLHGIRSTSYDHFTTP